MRNFSDKKKWQLVLLLCNSLLYIYYTKNSISNFLLPTMPSFRHWSIYSSAAAALIAASATTISSLPHTTTLADNDDSLARSSPSSSSRSHSLFFQNLLPFTSLHASASASSSSSSSPPKKTTVLACGLNLTGQLGLGSDRPYDTPTPIHHLEASHVEQVAAGNNVSAAITQSGLLYTWGNGSYGQLGNGDDSNLNIPVNIDQVPAIQKLSVGGFHMVALDHSGTCYSWGRSPASGHPSHQFVPKKIPGDLGQKKVKVIACGRLHSAAVDQNGNLWTWGVGYEGALGHGNKENQPTPKQLQFQEDSSKVSSVACGRDFTLALLENGQVYSCGADDYGQLGQGRGHGERYVRDMRKVVGGLKNVTKIAAGDVHACALDQDGNVWMWGFGREGQMGNGEKSDQAIPKIVESLKGKKVVDIACGGGHVAAITQDKELYLWGRGRDGQLARGDHVESIAVARTTPQLIDSIPPACILQAALGADHTILLIQSQ